MNLYTVVRNLNTAKALTSGNPSRIARRGKNIVVGRALSRVGFFSGLWK